MERRIHRRIYVNERAAIVLDNETYNGLIVNASQSGVSFMITSPFKLRDDTVLNLTVGLLLHNSSETESPLDCEIVWTKKGLYTSKTIALGMRIVKSSEEYDRWIKKLSH